MLIKPSIVFGLFLFVVSYCVISFSGVVSSTNAEDLDVQISFAATELQACDPLFALVSIRNPRSSSLGCRSEIGEFFSTSFIEYSRPNETEVRRYSPVIVCVHSLAIEVDRLLPGESRVVPLCIILRPQARSDDSVRIVENPGTYRFRCRVSAENSDKSLPQSMLTGVSDWKEIRVLREPWGDAAQDAMDVISSFEMHAFPSRSVTELRELQRGLDKSILKSTLSWVTLIAQLKDCDPGREDALRAELLSEFRKLDPITQMHARFALARMYYDAQKWREAIRVAKQIPGENYLKRRIIDGSVEAIHRQLRTDSLPGY